MTIINESSLFIYGLDYVLNPRAKLAEIEAGKEELGILFSHISQSLERLRLVFIMPRGMAFPENQAELDAYFMARDEYWNW